MTRWRFYIAAVAAAACAGAATGKGHDGAGSFNVGGKMVPAEQGPHGSKLYKEHADIARGLAMGRKHGDAPGLVLPFEGERIVLPPSGRRRSHSKKRKGWPGKCLGKGGDNPLKFTTIFGNDHLSPNGEDAHSDVDMAHKTARALCTDLCHHFHQWCLAIELKAPVAAGRGQHHPPECSLVTDEETFDQAGGTLHDARWGGRQHFHNDVYLTYCGGAGCSFHHAGDWNGGKVNDAAGFQCFPAIGFDDEYAFNPDRLLDEDGKALKPGYNHGKKHHRGMGRASAGDAEQEKIIAQQEEDSAIDELKKMRADLDEKLANLEKLEAARKNRRTKKE